MVEEEAPTKQITRGSQKEFLPDSEGWYFLYNPQEREVVKRRAVDMIRAAEEVEMVIFLDKSARPLSQFFINLWPAIYPDRPKPKIRYLNIGREKLTQLKLFKAEKDFGNIGFYNPNRISTGEAISQITDANSLEEIFGKKILKT